jgi:hypothetical protein
MESPGRRYSRAAPAPCTSMTAPHPSSERRRPVGEGPSGLMSMGILHNASARFRSSTDPAPPSKCSSPPKTTATRLGHGGRTAPTKA